MSMSKNSLLKKIIKVTEISLESKVTSLLEGMSVGCLLNCPLNGPVNSECDGSSESQKRQVSKNADEREH